MSVRRVLASAARAFLRGFADEFLAKGTSVRCEPAAQRWQRTDAKAVRCPVCGAAPGDACEYLGEHFVRKLYAYERARDCAGGAA